MDEPGNTTDRNLALDFTKGTLVLFMVLYHWINYFVTTDGRPVYTYLRFITPSFIFIAGFLITNIYPFKYGLGNPETSKRLISRGLKLLAMFTILNIIANAIFTTNYKGAMPGIGGFLGNAVAIYVSGNASASFAVLVPISYLLLLSACIVRLEARWKYFVHFFCAGLFICVVLLNVFHHSSSNLEMIAIGVLGMVFGFYPIDKIDRWAAQVNVLIALNLAYIIAISIWNVVYILQVFGVCISVMLIYSMGVKGIERNSIDATITLLGKYSLFAYVAQIGLLQLLHRGLFQLDLGTEAVWTISFFGAMALTVLSIKIMHWGRIKSPIVDTSYKTIFF
jgi:acyltransferase-like protein